MLSLQEIRETYRAVLGREVENNAAIVSILANHRDQLDLLRALLWSDEFLVERGQRLDRFGVPSLDDLRLFMAFPRHYGPGVDGYVTDFLGTLTSVRFIHDLPAKNRLVERYPFPHGNFHGDLNEWVGTLLAVIEAKPAGRLTVVELGAGWGPWLVASARAASKLGIGEVALVGVEACADHVAFLREHCRTNGIDPDRHRILHGVVAPHDGEAGFPVVADPALEWGHAAVFDEDATGEPARGEQPTGALERLPAYALATILDGLEVVDLMHVDIQGAELAVIESGLDVLGAKVKSMVIGTHGRGIEEKLVTLLSQNGWLLCRESGCQLAAAGGDRIVTYADGCQVWRNRRFFAA